MADSVPFSRMLFDSDEDAYAALKRVGGIVDERLSMTATYPVVGTIRRHFAILGNAIELAGVVEDNSVLYRIDRHLHSPENSQVLDQLEMGKLDYTPCNKRIVRRVLDDLHQAGVHLPWAFKMMNFDFGMTISKVQSAEDCYGFAALYNHLIRMSDESGEIMIGLDRIFSLPINDISGGTWLETISEDLLDEDLALVMEANSRA